MMGKMEIRSPPGSRPRDGRHCDLCGCSQPAVRCDKCGCQIFCLSCDDMYHRHPKRRFHLRKAVDPMPATSQARPILPMKASHLNAINPGDPSKMPLPPPRKKKSLFSSFRKPSSENNSPPLPKKEYSWTDRLGSIKKFMSNRPLPPLPLSDDNDTDSQPATNGQAQRGDLSFIHKRTEERPPQLPQRSPRSPDFPGMNQEKENRIPSTPPHLPGQIRNGSLETNANHMNQNHQFNSNDPNHWNNQTNHQNDGQGFGTLNRQRPFMPPGAPGYPGGMHQSSSATDLHSLHNPEAMRGQVPPHYPHYPVNPHMPPHYPYPMYPGYPNYPQYFGNSFANLSNPPTSEGDFSDSEASSKHSSKRHAFRKRAKRSQSVVMDRMAYPGQFFPFGGYPGYPWGAPMPMEAPPSPASSVRSLNRSGRARRRKKGTSEEDDEELSETSSPMSRPKSSSSDPKEHPRAPLATQTTSSEYESDDNADKRRNKINTIRRPPEPVKSPSPAVNRKVAKLKKSSSKQSDSDTPESPAARNDRRPSDSTTDQRQPVRQSPVQQQPVRQSPVQQQPVRQSPVQQQPNLQRSPTPQQLVMRESPVPQSTPAQPQTSNSGSSENWECRHCTFVNPIGNRICQVCCKTATPRTETPVSNQSRPASSSAKHRKESVGSENEYFVPDETNENEASKKDKQDMASLNSALDEAEKQISRGLEELMKLKDDIDSSSSKDKTRSPETQSKTDSEDKPVYKSSGRMRTSILDKLNLNKSQTANSSVSTSTETQTDQNNRTIDKIITARRLSNSSSASEAYNSPTAQSPELERGYLGNKQKRDSSCQTQQDTISDYLEKRKVAEESFLGRPINNFGFTYGDRMDMVTSPVPSMYDRFYGGGYGMMQRSHSRASLFTGRMNDFGPMDYGPGPGFGYGPTPMYRSVSRGSLTGDYPQNTIADYLEKRKVAEESFLGRPINNFGFSYGDRMDMVTSPIPPMYDRFYGGGYGMMQRSHSRASLFTCRMNDFGPMDYGPGPGFGYGPTPMYRSVSRGSLAGDYPDGRVSGFQNSRKPDYYLSMEELVERRCQDNINNIRAQGLELVRMIREAEQQGFNADDIQVALTHCGKQNPLEWLQENWRNMVDSVVTLSTNYGNDKKENDIGLLSENEARDALRLHKGNIWAAVTECVEGRQRKYLELSARGNFSRQDIVDALTAGDGDVEMAYAKLTKSTGKPFLMRIWGQGEGAQNQDGAQPMPEQFRDGPRRFLKDDTLNNDDLSDDLWSEDDGPVEWDDEEDYEEERGDIEDLRTCQEDLPSNTQDVTTPESERSDYCDAFSVDDRNASSPSDDVFFVIPPEAKPEKKKGFLSKLVALRRDSKERAETSGKEEVSSQQDNKPNEDSISERTTNSSEQKNGGALNTLKNKFSAIKDSVTGGTKNDKKAPTAQLDRRTIIVRGQLEHESLSTKEDTKATPINNSSAENTSKIPNSDAQNKKEIKPSEEVPVKEAIKLTKEDNKKTPTPILSENDQIKTEKGYIENESKQLDSKKAENKNSQSLAERLKFAKQTRSSFDAPGPSGINKESLVQPALTKMDTPTQPKNEISLQKDANKNSKNIPEKEGTTDKTSFDKIPRIQNLDKYESTEKSISANQNNHQVAENIANVKIVKSNDIQNSEALQTARQDQSKESSEVTSTKSTKTSTLTSKSLNSNTLEMKKESSPKPQVEHGSDKQSTIKSETKINSENAIKSKSPIAKNMENKPSPLLVSEKGDNHTRISEASKQNNISKADTSTTIANLSGKNTPTELKITNSEKEKPKNAVTHTKKFSAEISNSENKTSLVKGRDEKDLNNQEGDSTKSKNEKAKLIKDDNKTVQQIENKIGNTETSSETANSSKSDENSKNLESAENSTTLEKSQKSLQENHKSEVIVLTKEENLVNDINESATKNVDSAQNIPTESSVANGIHQTTISDKITKTDETLKTATSDDIPKTESDIPSDRKIHKVELKSEESATDSGAIKNLKETNLIEFFKHDIQNNLEKSETLSENKSVAQINKTLPDLSATSSNAIIENPPTQEILQNTADHLELDHDMPKGKSVSSEASSKHLISNKTNAVQSLDIVNKESSSANIEHVENLPQTSKQGTDASQRKDIDTSSAQNLETISDNSQSVTEINKESKVDTSMISSENNKELVVNSEAEKAESSEKIKGESITATTDEVAENLLPSNSSFTNLEPAGDISKSSDDNSLVNKVEMLNKDINEHHAKEIPVNKNILNEKETEDVTNSINKSPESELKNSEIKVVLEGESELISANTALEKALHASPEVIQNTFASTENQNKLTSAATPSTSKDNSVPSNDHEKIEQPKIQTASESDPTKTANLSSSEIINNDVSNDMKLLEPVLSKEFPDKNIVEAPVLSDNIEETTTPVISESVNSESLSTALRTISDNSKISEISPSTNTSDSDKSPKALLSTSNLENTSTSSESVMNNSKTTVELGNVLANSNTAASATTAEISFTEDNSLSVNATESSKTEQNSSNTNIDNSSVLEKIAAIAKAANDSINEISATNTASSSVITSDSSIANSSDSTKIIPSASSTTDSNTKEISVSKLSTLSSDTKSLSNDAKSSALKLTEQHSKAPEDIAANSSASSTIKNSSSTPTVPSVQNKVFQRTPSEELNESSASESEDTDIEFSDNSRDSSRRGSLMLPSPVDALRSRFEGLASGATIRGGPIRPASPFRRMSFNSRKQVIALERKKDTSTDKPWYHKIDPEPARIVQPKRSVKQQLEMERKVRKMVADRKCRTYKKAEIVVQLMEMNFEEEEAIQAANECSTLEQAISYLQQECSLCTGHFSVSQIISMTHCEHRACRECIRAYFTVQIRDRTILDLLCPFCNEPDIGDEDVAQDYFNHLDIMLKKLVDTEIHELFQRKLRDRVLMKDPNFRWCSQCSSGFIAMPNLKRLICPDCNAVTCASCRRLWEKEHQGISCEAFAAMKDATDPEAQAAGLAKMLTEDGISCPSCHFRYALAKGGCMHFRCIQCQHDFCSGCSRPFKMGQKCGVSEFCVKLGLHAHHPRNCLFYLRDKEPEDLQKLLDMNDVKYNREPPEGMEIKSTCQVMEQKETADGMMDDYCGKDVQDGYAGLCRVHYVEYLGQLVNKHKVDPIQIFDNDDLELVLKRANIRLPPKRYRENDAQYREKLIKVIQEELPLDRMDGS